MSQRAPLLFNPSRASFEELEKTFVGRWPQLEAFERDLLADGAGPSTRHWLLIGPRGSGKSHFTELLSRRLRQNHGWAVVRLPEEHYQVASVAELLEQILLRLEGLKASPFAREREPRKVEELAIDRLRAWKQKHGKPFLVILENLGQLLERADLEEVVEGSAVLDRGIDVAGRRGEQDEGGVLHQHLPQAALVPAG